MAQNTGEPVPRGAVRRIRRVAFTGLGVALAGGLVVLAAWLTRTDGLAPADTSWASSGAIVAGSIGIGIALVGLVLLAFCLIAWAVMLGVEAAAERRL